MLGKRRRGSASSDNLQIQDNIRSEGPIPNTSTTKEPTAQDRSPQYSSNQDNSFSWLPDAATASAMHRHSSSAFESRRSQSTNGHYFPSGVYSSQINHQCDTLLKGVLGEDCKANPPTKTFPLSVNLSAQQVTPSGHSTVRVKAYTSLPPLEFGTDIAHSNSTQQQLSLRRLGSLTPSNSAAPQRFQREPHTTRAFDHTSTVHEQQEAPYLPDTENQPISFTQDQHSAKTKPVAHSHTSESNHPHDDQHECASTGRVGSHPKALASEAISPRSTSPPQRSEHQLTQSKLAQLQGTESLAGRAQFPAPFHTFSRPRSSSPSGSESVEEN
ncbi:MAG: hypothetical protein Q9196_001123, partial [Gyalolechia fulgens]